MAANTGVMAGFRKGKPIMIDFDAGSTTYLAGDVLVIGPTPFVFHDRVPQFAGGPTRDALAAGGGIYECVADGAMPVLGVEVFWDATNKKVTLTAVGNTHFGRLLTGPTFLLSGAGPAADGDLCWVLHDPKSVATSGQSGAYSETTQSTTATLSAAQLLGGFINSAPAGAITLTLPTAANMIAGMPGCKVGDRFRTAIENTAGGANTITLAAGGATLRGGTSIAQNKSAILEGVITNVGAGTEAYTVYSVVGA
jgi:hypothetical protein